MTPETGYIKSAPAANRSWHKETRRALYVAELRELLLWSEGCHGCVQIAREKFLCLKLTDFIKGE